MTVEELRARKEALLAQKRRAAGEGDRFALFLVNEELLDVNARLRARTPGRKPAAPRRVSPGEKEWALDRAQFQAWRQAEEVSGEEAGDGREPLRHAAAQGVILLSPRRREVLERHLAGNSNRETAAALGLAPSTVSRVLSNAKKHLQEEARRAAAAARLDGEKTASIRLDLATPEAAKAVLAVLSPKQAAYFYLRYSVRLSLRETASLAGTNPSTVSRTLCRARERAGRLWAGRDVLLLRPETLDGPAYQAYCRMGGPPGDVPRGAAMAKRCVKPPAAAPPCGTVRVAKRPGEGTPTPRLLAALKERFPKEDVFHCLEWIFWRLGQKM